MDIQAAREILAAIEATSLAELREDLIAKAVRYARIRTDWWRMAPEERRAADAMRTAAHDALIDACNILSRNMAKTGEDNTWRARLGDDRRVIGDFACLLHAILGIRAR